MNTILNIWSNLKLKIKMITAYAVVLPAKYGHEAIKLYLNEKPDLIMMDI